MSTEATTVTLSTGVIKSLSAALAKGISTATNSGNALADFFAAAVGAKLAVTPVAADVNAIVDACAAEMKWSGASEKVRKSEARVIVAQHALLPEGITAMRTATGSCDYHRAVKVGRAIKEYGNVAAAVAYLTAEQTKKKADYMANITRALNAFHKAATDSVVRSATKVTERQTRLEAVATFATAIGIELK